MPNPIGRSIFLRRSVTLLGLVGLSLVSCSFVSDGSTKSQLQRKVKTMTQQTQKKMKLESDSFSANGVIPSKYTCDGENISPSLKWDEPPVGTQSFALIVDDPDAPNGTFVHWVLYDLPPETRSLPEGIPAEPFLAGGGIQGMNDFDRFGYGGPCPPSGTHRYFFKLYALDTTLGLESDATKDRVEAAIAGRVLASAELIGRYSRKR